MTNYNIIFCNYNVSADINEVFGQVVVNVVAVVVQQRQQQQQQQH